MRRTQIPWWLVGLTRAALALAVLLIVAVPAGAQEAPKVEAPAIGGEEGEEEEGVAPGLRVVGFRDRAGTGDCDPIEARFGRCVEEVDFVDLLPAWSKAEASPAQLVLWRNTSVLYAQLWEDMAQRWFQSGDVVETSMRNYRIDRLPTVAQQWEASIRKDKRVFALPGPELWLDRSLWVEQRGARAPNAFYRSIRYLAPEGQASQPEMVLLSGRFALRLGFAGKRHDFDLMNGDPTSSGPFFEQMYPYSQAMETSDANLVPLASFSEYQRLLGEAHVVQTHEDMTRLARREFYVFSRLIATQIAQFGLEDYTTNHMRVLTALTAMQSPPGALEQRTGRSGDLVAAALGETDSKETVEERLGESIYRLERGFDINYFQLPIELTEKYLAELVRERGIPEEFWPEFNEFLLYDLEDLLRVQVGQLTSLDDVSVRTWVRSFSRPGTSEDMVTLHVKRIALNLLVEDLSKDERDELQTRMLLDHVNMEVTSIFDSSAGAKAPPAELVEATAGKWESVLNKHGYLPGHFRQGLGAVDPTSICTTLDGPAALEEPVFGVVSLDLLFADDDVPIDNDKILWHARKQLPFIMVDSPETAPAEVERLVGLPDGRAIYRARWELWAGWHLFWTTADTTDGSGAHEVMIRTGAVCDDTVLTSPELVPTLVRTALLDGNFRPTTPVLKADVDRRAAELGETDNDKLIQTLAGEVDKGADLVEQVEAAEEAAEEAPESVPEQVDLSIPDVGGLFGIQGAGLKEEAKPITRYIHEVMRPSLFGLSRREGPLMVVVFDTTTSEDRVPLKDRRPRTPYARKQLRVPKADKGEERFVRTAVWAHFVNTIPEPNFTLVSPSYRTTESVNTRTPMPRWGRVRTLDWTLFAGLGFMPIRFAEATCDDAFQDADPSTVSCVPSSRYSEGLSIEVGGAVTWWIVDDQRLAVEFGPDVQLDVTPGGVSPVWDEYDDNIKAWTFRPQFGLMVGLRGAPDPNPLVRRIGGGLPWGAENPDGRSRQERVQLGFRTLFLMGPGFNGLEATVGGEFWFGGSVRGKRSPHATFTPYHPAMILGPYFRGQVEFVLGADDPKFKKLDYGVAAIVGIRAQMRLKKKTDLVPEE